MPLVKYCTFYIDPYNHWLDTVFSEDKKDIILEMKAIPDLYGKYNEAYWSEMNLFATAADYLAFHSCLITYNQI